MYYLRLVRMTDCTYCSQHPILRRLQNPVSFFPQNSASSIGGQHFKPNSHSCLSVNENPQWLVQNCLILIHSSACRQSVWAQWGSKTENVYIQEGYDSLCSRMHHAHFELQEV